MHLYDQHHTVKWQDLKEWQKKWPCLELATQAIEIAMNRMGKSKGAKKKAKKQFCQKHWKHFSDSSAL